jgi:hypothetical protein
LAKEARDREEEETLLDRVLLNTLADSFAIPDRLFLPLLPGEILQEETQPAEDILSKFLAGAARKVHVESDGRVQSEGPAPRVLLPGSFNPLHPGHCALAIVTARLIGHPAEFELSVSNADKPSLAAEEVRRRLAQFSWRSSLWLTHAPTYSEKADLFPGAVFVVGADTAARIVEPRFYDSSEERMAQALANIRAHGCHFLVAGRVDAQGHFRGLEEIGIAAPFQDLFTAIAPSDFRCDISSTQLRAAAPTPPA